MHELRGPCAADPGLRREFYCEPGLGGSLFLKLRTLPFVRSLEAAGTDANEVVLLDDERVLQDVGIYRYHHPLENAVDVPGSTR